MTAEDPLLRSARCAGASSGRAASPRSSPPRCAPTRAARSSPSAPGDAARAGAFAAAHGVRHRARSLRRTVRRRRRSRRCTWPPPTPSTATTRCWPSRPASTCWWRRLHPQRAEAREVVGRGPGARACSPWRRCGPASSRTWPSCTRARRRRDRRAGAAHRRPRPVVRATTRPPAVRPGAGRRALLDLGVYPVVVRPRPPRPARITVQAAGVAHRRRAWTARCSALLGYAGAPRRS